MKEVICESMVTSEVTTENRIFRTSTPKKKAHISGGYAGQCLEHSDAS
jgi:hypothetical protein